MKTIALYCQEGSANKEYHIEIVASGVGFVVNTRHGPRGRATVAGSLTDLPVDLEKANKLFDARLKRQLGKGYTPDTSGMAYTATPDAGRVSGWRPVLLSPIDEKALEAAIESPAWVASEKFFGERRGVEVAADGSLKGMNRKGLYVDVPAKWGPILGQLPPGTILDGEHMGDGSLRIFDCPQVGSRDLRGIGYMDRLMQIMGIMTGVSMPLGVDGRPDPMFFGVVRMVPVAETAAAKRELKEAVAGRGGEGLVLRLCDGPYGSGITDGNFKFKFYESSTCIVKAKNAGKRSVSLVMLDASGIEVDVGNVTIPADQAIPVAGALVEVRYLHMYEGGSLYESAYLGVRTDLYREDCKLSQVMRVMSKSQATTDNSMSDVANSDEVPDYDLPDYERPRG